MHEILETLQLDLTQINYDAMYHAIINNDFEVIKYVLSIDGIRLNDDILLRTIMSSTFDVVVYLLNVYLCKSIPSHLHNQFHIFQYSKPKLNLINLSIFNQNNKFNVINNNILNNNDNENNIKEEFNSKTHKRDRSDSNDTFINQNNTINLSHHYVNTNKKNNNLNNDGANDYFLKLVEHNFNKIIIENDSIWRGVCSNKDIDVVQLILSLKGIQPDLLNRGDEFNQFLIACKYNSNIKVIKYIHKLFPPFIHSQLNVIESTQNGAYLVINNYRILLKLTSDKLKILHYLYLNGIDIHLLSKKITDRTVCDSIYSLIKSIISRNCEDIVQHLKVISQDFDYQNNEHDHKAYRKPSFWKQFHNNNNNNNINNNISDEQSMRINEWKNRFDNMFFITYQK